MNLETFSLILNAALLVWAIYERVLSKRDKDYIKASIRVWQHQAQGITSALKKLASSSGGVIFSLDPKFTRVKDVGIALDALREIADSMNQSLYESRFFTDEELKMNIKKDKEREDEEEKKKDTKNINKKKKK